MRHELDQQIINNEKHREEERKKKEEYDMNLNNAIQNMNKKVWEDNKTESQREREKEEYKDELENQIKEKHMKDGLSQQQKREYEIEEEKRVKREVLELNNQFRIENGEDPLPIPPELLPANNLPPSAMLNEQRSIEPNTVKDDIPVEEPIYSSPL